MSWPPNSPDLSPMEHIWNVMERQLRAQTPPCPNISTLRDCCLDIWYNRSPVMYQKLVAFIPSQSDLEHLVSPEIEAYNMGGCLPADLSEGTGPHLCFTWRKTRKTSNSQFNRSEKFAAKPYIGLPVVE
ncbi:hypothetical protein AVEN_124902-1 [Araneus ventricosus]|uniref:Tc1-like transposase DDE domain-containing protein n=1 Tax=Araneus ventricosus TaxID=182803 RepID=A0A4Y2FZT7_ARAVE|nr:hypothetical protein AVEN_124902-1 [Araneus ventricosus]